MRQIFFRNYLFIVIDCNNVHNLPTTVNVPGKYKIPCWKLIKTSNRYVTWILHADNSLQTENHVNRFWGPEFGIRKNVKVASINNSWMRYWLSRYIPRSSKNSRTRSPVEIKAIEIFFFGKTVFHFICFTTWFPLYSDESASLTWRILRIIICFFFNNWMFCLIIETMFSFLVYLQRKRFTVMW